MGLLVGKLSSLFSAHPLMVLYICIKFHENISKGFKFIEGRYFHYSKYSKEHNSVKM